MPRHTENTTRLGPEPLLAHCDRCGASWEKPPLPMPTAEFTKLLQRIEKHECHPQDEH